MHQAETLRAIQIEPERISLVGHGAAPDRLDRCNHPTVATEHAIGERHDTRIGRCRRRRTAKLLRDCELAAFLIERASRDIRARGLAADPGIAVHHQRLTAIPAAHETDELPTVLPAGSDIP